jgi:hypothetical protein
MGPLSGGPAQEAWKEFLSMCLTEGYALDDEDDTTWMDITAGK